MNDAQAIAAALLANGGNKYPDWLSFDDVQGDYELTFLMLRRLVKQDGARQMVVEFLIDKAGPGSVHGAGTHVCMGFPVFHPKHGKGAQNRLNDVLCTAANMPVSGENGAALFGKITPKDWDNVPEDFVCPLMGARVRLKRSGQPGKKDPTKTFTKDNWITIQQTREDRVARCEQLTAAKVAPQPWSNPVSAAPTAAPTATALLDSIKLEGIL